MSPYSKPLRHLPPEDQRPGYMILFIYEGSFSTGMYLYARAVKVFNMDSYSPSASCIVAFPYWVGVVRLGFSLAPSTAPPLGWTADRSESTPEVTASTLPTRLR